MKALKIRLEERTRRLRWAIHGWFVRRGPRVFVASHWPWPLRKPYQREALTILPPGGGIGDELMCMAVFAEIKRRNPRCRITFVSRYPEFFRGHPAIDEVVPKATYVGDGALKLAYHYSIPPPRPLITLLAECAGMVTDSQMVTVPPSTPDRELVARVERIGMPFIVVQPLSSGWTTNKSWPIAYWQKLIAELLKHWIVVEVGTQPAFPGDFFHGAFHSLAGQTGIPELAWVISQAALFVGPSSAGMHLAHAAGTPAVIIFGGYERAAGYPFPRLRALESQIACAPCWKTTCPFELACLRGIPPEQVFQEVQAAMSGASARL